MNYVCPIASAILLGAASLAGTPGDPAAGKALFEGKGGCFRCHSVEQRGGSLGPDLSDARVLRTAESLRLAITDPDAEIEPDYFTIRVLAANNERIEGIRLNEDDFSLQLRDAQGQLRSFRKPGLKGIWREPRSLMPSYRSKLTVAEINDVVAWLCSLRGALVSSGDGFLRTRSIAPVSERLDWLTRPQRDTDERPDAVLDFLRIPAGAVVADIGAGAGYFTWRLARRVGASGKVIAVEIQRAMLGHIAQDLKKRNITNVDLVLGGDDDPRLPAGAVDLVLIANAYHEFAQPEAMMKAIRRSLKPNARVVVLEYRKENAYSPVEPLHKMTLQDVRSEIESAGFETEQVLDTLPIQHFLIFRRRDSDGVAR